MTPTQPRRRILLVLSTLGWAGAETQVIHLASGLARRGHQLTVAALRDAAVNVEPLEDLGVRILTLGAESRARRLLTVVQLARIARRMDLVHSTGWDTTLWGRLAALLARRPMTITEQTPGRDEQVSRSGAPRGRWLALHNRLLGRFTARTVACGRWQIPLLESEGVPSASIVHIPNAVPVDELQAAASNGGVTREQLGLGSRTKILFQGARLLPHKNQRATIAVLERLRGHFGDVRALLVGEGSDRSNLEREAREQGTEGVHFLGRRDDIPELLGLSDLVVHPSRAEGLPLVLLEAIAVGVPVVAADAGDVKRLLDETGAGICVGIDDAEALFAACRDILEDESLHRRLSENARENSRRFDAAAMTSDYEALFESVIASRESVRSR